MRFAVSFERREGADVVNAPLFVERRHRLSSNDLSAGRSHCRITDIRVDHPDCALNHIPAVVDLGHNPIGFVLAVQRDSGAGPFGQRISGGLISKQRSALGHRKGRSGPQTRYHQALSGSSQSHGVIAVPAMM